MEKIFSQKGVNRIQACGHASVNRTVYARIYERIYAYMRSYKRIYDRTYAYIQLYRRAYTDIPAYIRLYTRAHTIICVHIRVYTILYTRTNDRVFAYIRSYERIYDRTYTYVRPLIQPLFENMFFGKNTFSKGGQPYKGVYYLPILADKSFPRHEFRIIDMPRHYFINSAFD